eukprot:6473807-Amphidinium_carterae.1
MVIATLSRQLLHLAVRACGIAAAGQFRACGVIVLSRGKCGWLSEDGNVPHIVLSFMMSPWAWHPDPQQALWVQSIMEVASA